MSAGFVTAALLVWLVALTGAVGLTLYTVSRLGASVDAHNTALTVHKAALDQAGIGIGALADATEKQQTQLDEQSDRLDALDLLDLAVKNQRNRLDEHIATPHTKPRPPRTQKGPSL